MAFIYKFVLVIIHGNGGVDEYKTNIYIVNQSVYHSI